jgi:hypothetical protein
MSRIGEYSKGIIALAGIATSAISQYYASATWAPLAIGGISAIVLILVPNASQKDTLNAGTNA